MTAFGKILVFLNLLFAIMTGGLIGMVYLTRTNWKANFETVQAARTADLASKDVEVQTERLKYQDLERQLATKRTESDANAQRAATLETERNKLKDELENEKRTSNKEAGNVETVTKEIERRRAEVKQLQEVLADRDVRIRDLEQKLTVTRDESVNAQLNYKSLKERFENMLAQNEEMARKLAYLERRGIRAEDPAQAKRPPVENVRGTVKAIDGNLATVSVGTDAGVNKDNVLFIYRLTPQPEYLGELQIISTTPFEAVGRIKPAQGRRVVKAGDEVSSNITGVR